MRISDWSSDVCSSDLDGVEPGGMVDLRVRANPGFRVPADDRPLLLVGNGTGLAGLRALLKARINAGHQSKWLLLGEGSAAHEGFNTGELQEWWANGAYTRIATGQGGGGGKEGQI